VHEKRLVVLAGLFTASIAQRALAEGAIEDVRIEYRAPEACPSEAWLLGRLQARTDRFRRVMDDRPARSFGIEIAHLGGSYVGTLTITEPQAEARPTSRRIEAPDCTEVAEGLALIAALTIDPRAKLEAPIEKSPEPPPPPPPPPPPVVKPPPPSPPPQAEEPARKLELRLGAGFVGSSGVAPELMYGGEGFFEVALADDRAWFAPALRLTFLRHVRREDIRFAEGTAHFRLTTMALDLCPLRAPVPILELRLCATAEGGLLEAEGTDTQDPDQSVRFWSALGARLRIGAELGRIGVQASVGAEAPLRRDSFVFDSPGGPVTVNEVDAVVWLAGLGVSVRVN
jgi:hypothetical protein